MNDLVVGSLLGVVAVLGLIWWVAKPQPRPRPRPIIRCKLIPNQFGPAFSEN